MQQKQTVVSYIYTIQIQKDPLIYLSLNKISLKKDENIHTLILLCTEGAFGVWIID